jgi:hypothetical protein
MPAFLFAENSALLQKTPKPIDSKKDMESEVYETAS